MDSNLQPQASSQALGQAPSYRVFLVEDSSAIRETLATSLESAGLVKIVGFAETADDAWRAVQRQPADAVIIDLHLRSGTGFDLLNRLKSVPALSGIKKLVLTNFATPAFRQRCASLGADYFFDKSLEFDRAIDVLDDLARMRQVALRPDRDNLARHASDCAAS